MNENASADISRNTTQLKSQEMCPLLFSLLTYSCRRKNVCCTVWSYNFLYFCCFCFFPALVKTLFWFSSPFKMLKIIIYKSWVFRGRVVAWPTLNDLCGQQIVFNIFVKYDFCLFADYGKVYIALLWSLNVWVLSVSLFYKSWIF